MCGDENWPGASESVNRSEKKRTRAAGEKVRAGMKGEMQVKK